MQFLIEESVMQRVRDDLGAVCSLIESHRDYLQSALAMRIMDEISQITNDINTALRSEVVVIPEGHEIAQWYYAHNDQCTKCNLFALKVNPADNGIVNVSVMPDKNSAKVK